jgi:hypothetical protein
VRINEELQHARAYSSKLVDVEVVSCVGCFATLAVSGLSGLSGLCSAESWCNEHLHKGEPSLRTHQFLSHARISQQYMESVVLLLWSQEPSGGPSLSQINPNNVVYP